MGLLRNIAERLDPAPGIKTEPPVESRAADPSWGALAGGGSDYPAALGGVGQWGDQRPALTPRLAETFSTVLACVNAISGAISSLPVWVYLLTEDGRKTDKTHDVARLVRDGANQHQSWPELIEWLTASTLLNGNGLAEIVADRRTGRIEALKPIPWPNVTVRLLPSGRIVYDVSNVNVLGGGSGKTRRLLDSEVIHLRDRSDDGLVGRSRLARTGPPVRAALTQEAFGEFLYNNRAAPSGVLSFEGHLSPEQSQTVKERVSEGWTGVRRAGKLLVLDSGAKYQPVTITPESLEMLSARKFSTEEVARLFGVPPPIIGIWDHSTFTNSETAGRWFAQFCLAPWIRKIEEAFRRSVFTAATRETHCIEFDMSGFLRGDASARWKNHAIAVKQGILTRNEVREVEGWNPRPELDVSPPESGEGIG
jgi:HK97 family phage portal protein